LNAERIFGPDVGWKTTRQDPSKVRMTKIMLPPDTFDRNQEAAVCADIMYINGIQDQVWYYSRAKFQDENSCVVGHGSNVCDIPCWRLYDTTYADGQESATISGG
jgi:hypothetical protein